MVTVSEILEGNKDEALRCHSIAQKHRNAENHTSAKKFIQKSLALFAASEAQKLAQIIESEASASTSTSTTKGTEEATRVTGTEKHPSVGGTHHRHPNGNASTNGSAEGSSLGSDKNGAPGVDETFKSAFPCAIRFRFGGLTCIRTQSFLLFELHGGPER